MKTTKKVGILSLYYRTYNYGAQLQAYALCKVISSMGYDCEQIQFAWSRIQTQISYENYSIDKKAFEEFYLKIPHSEEVYFPENILKSNHHYSHFVCGSDQIWGAEKSMPLYTLPIMSLGFANEDKVRIAYAASMGGVRISDDRLGAIKSAVEKMDEVSVREKSSIAFMKEHFDRDVQAVLDPVFLLEKEKWDEITQNLDSEEYVFLYNISENKDLDRVAEQISEKKHIQIKKIGYVGAEKYGPIEFISLIKYATYVVTDSFHGTAFSIIFHKDFLAFPGDAIKSDYSKNYRLTDMLESLGLSERFVNEVSDEDLINSIDWSEADRKLNAQIVKSKEFLLKGLSRDNSEKVSGIITREKCIGCGNCYKVCRNNCIKMVEDSLGFSYPTVDRESCVNCGECEKYCPVIQKRKSGCLINKAYSYKSNSDSVRMHSSSGGAFYDIAKKFISKGGCVIAVKYSKSFKAIHDICRSESELRDFCQSKYVQSSNLNIYDIAKGYLNKGTKVLFVGTPCQVASLKNFLGEEQENLVCIDLICGGVTSPKLFEKYVSEKQIAGQLNNISMRSKARGYKEKSGLLSFSMKLEYDNYSIDIPKSEDRFLETRFSFYRDSCFECDFKEDNRMSDLTIGDDLVSEDDGLGKTLIIVRTLKGEKLLEEIMDSTNCSETDYSAQKTRNRMIEHCFTPPAQYLYIREKISSSMDEIYYQNLNFNSIVETDKVRRELWIERLRNDLLIKVIKFKEYELVLEDIPSIRDKILIYGAGKIGKELKDCGGIKIIGYIDGAGKMTNCLGLPVYLPEDSELKKNIGDGKGCTVIVTPIWDMVIIEDKIRRLFPEIDVVSLADIMQSVR